VLWKYLNLDTLASLEGKIEQLCWFEPAKGVPIAEVIFDFAQCVGTSFPYFPPLKGTAPQTSDQHHGAITSTTLRRSSEMVWSYWAETKITILATFPKRFMNWFAFRIWNPSVALSRLAVNSSKMQSVGYSFVIYFKLYHVCRFFQFGQLHYFCFTIWHFLTNFHTSYRIIPSCWVKLY